MSGYPHFSFWIPITLAKIYFFPMVITFAKKTSLLGGTVFKNIKKINVVNTGSHVFTVNFPQAISKQNRTPAKTARNTANVSTSNV